MPPLPQEEQLQKSRPAPQQGQVPTATPDPQTDAMQQLFGQKAQAPTPAPAPAPAQVPAQAPSAAQAQVPQPKQAQPATTQPVDWQGALPGIAQKYGIQPDLIQRVIRAESAGNVRALSPKGAMGLMQLMPNTAKGLGVDPYDPLQNLEGGTRELKRLLDKYQGHYGRALAAYNAGETAVDRTEHFEELPAETQAYVHGIMQGYQPPGAQQPQVTQQPQNQQAQTTSMANRFQGYSDLGQGLRDFFGGRGSATVGQAIPDVAMPALQATQKYAIDPLNRMGEASAKALGQVFKEETANPSGPAGMEDVKMFKPEGPLPEGFKTSGFSQVPMGISAALGETIGGTLGDPRNWPFLGSGTARPLLQRLISGGFGIQMSHGAATNAMDLYQNWDNYSPEQRANLITKAGLTAYFAKESAGHALFPGAPEPARISDAGRERVQTAPTTPQPMSAQVQVAPKQSPSIAQEGGPTPVTQTGVTGAREVTGGRVPAMASAPIEGAGLPAGTAAPKTGQLPTLTLEEARQRVEALHPERRGLQAQAPYTGPERRLTDVAREQMVSTPMGVPTPGEELAQRIREARAGQPHGISEGQALNRIQLDPERYKIFSAADPKTRNQMLIEARNEISKERANVQGPSGLPQAATQTPAQPRPQPVPARGPAEEPTRAPGKSLQPLSEPVRQPLQQVASAQTPKSAYKPLPATERPRVSVGGRVETRPTALEQKLEGLKQPTPAERTPAEVQPGVQATPRPAQASGEQLESWKTTRRAEAAARQEAMRQEAPYAPKIETRSPVGAALDRYLKPPGTYKGDRGAELVRAVEDVKRQGPETIQKASEELQNRATRANNMAEWGQRHLEGRETDEMATERLGAGHMAERGVPEALGAWAESKGFKWSQAPEWRREISSSKAEALNRIRGNQLKEVGEPRERTAEEETQLKTLEDARDRLVAELRKQSKPTERALEQLDTLIVNIQALKGTRFVAAAGPKTAVGERGELLPTGTRATSEMLNRFMGRPEGAHGRKPSMEDIQARVRELQKEGQWASNLAKELGSPARVAETRPTEVATKAEAPTPKAPAPKAPEPVTPKTAPEAPIKGAGVPSPRMQAAIRREISRPHVERPTEAPKAAPVPGAETKSTPASELFARQSEELQSQRQHLANLINKGYGDTRQASDLRKTIGRIEGTLGLKAPAASPEVSATLEGQGLLRAAKAAEPKPAPEKAVYAPETVVPTAAEELHELLVTGDLGTPLMEKLLTPDAAGQYRLSETERQYLTEPILKDFKSSDLTAGEASHRLNRALEVLVAGRKKASTLTDSGDKGSAMAKAFNDAVTMAKTGKLPAPGVKEGGFIGRPGGKGLEAAKRIREEREREEQGPFYNMSERVVRENWPGGASAKASPKDIAGMLTNAGVSKNELKWSDVDSYLLKAQKEGRQVTQKEVLDYLKAKNPKIEVTEKVRDPDSPDAAFQEKLRDANSRSEKLNEDIRNIAGVNQTGASAIHGELVEGLIRGANVEDLKGILPDLKQVPDAKIAEWLSEVREIVEINEALEVLDNARGNTGPRYESYSLPGGENYREVLLRMPAGSVKAERPLSAGEEKYGERYQGPHFDEPNVVAHLRLKDRVDADGKKTLFIEEVQSDWDRDLRQQGSSPEEMRARGFNKDIVPEMPFTQGHWLELAMKHVLKEAASKGYDKVAWTTGEQQADRYSLRNEFDKINYVKNVDGTYDIGGTPKGAEPGQHFGREFARNIGADELDRYVGKALADKIRAGDRSRIVDAGTDNKLSVIDLDKAMAVGGEHHLTLYDKMIPQFMERYGKKWGAKVVESEIQTTKGGEELPYRQPGMPKWAPEGGELATVHSMPIPEGMRDVLKKPLRQIGGSQAGVFQLGGGRLPAGRQLSPRAQRAKEAFGRLMERIQGARTSLARNREAQNLNDRVQDLKQQNKADVLRYYTAQKGLEVPPSMRARIDDFRNEQLLPADKRSLSLTPQEQAINDKVVTPIVEDNTRIIQKLSKTGFTTEDIAGLTHRVPLGKGQTVEKIIERQMKVGPGNVLSKFASSRYRGKYVAMTDPSTGDRMVARVSNSGRVYLYDKGQQLGGDVGYKSEFENGGYKFSRATTNEVQAATGRTYHKDAILNNIIENIALRRAERIHDFVENLKEEPEFQRLATTNKDVASALGFRRARVVNGEWLPQFKGYHFEPHVAEVLEREWAKFQKGDTTAYERANNWLKRSIFWNPLLHVPNIGVHWLGEKGLTGMAKLLFNPTEYKALSRSIDVMSDPEKYAQMLDAGLPLMRQPNVDDVTNLFVTKATKEIVENKKGAGLAKAFGYASPVHMAKAIFKGSSEITWGTHDLAILQGTFARMERNGWDLKTAADEVTKHIPNYRMPPRVWNSRFLGRLMDTPGISMFSQYHYGAFKSYGEMVKELVAPLKPGDRSRALDRMLALGLITYVLYPQADKLAKGLSGDKDAVFRRAGSSTFVNNVGKVLTRKMGVVPFAESVVTPAPIVGAGIKALQSRQLTQKGQPLVGTLEKPGAAIKAGQIALESLGPVTGFESGQATPGQGAFSWRRFLFKLLGGRMERPIAQGGRGMKMGLPGLSRIGKRP